MKKTKILVILLLMIFLQGCIKNGLTYTLNPGKDTIELNESWADQGITMKFNGITLEATVDMDALDNQTIGDYLIVYSASYNNVTYLAYRYVFVRDQTAPVATLNPGVDTIRVGSSWVDAGVTASDNSGTIDIMVQGTVNTDVVGEYIISYIIMDASLNETIVTRIVSVIA